MKAFSYNQTGGASTVLQLVDRPIPSLKSGEVRVQVRASGINPSDTKRRSGDFPQPFEIEEVIPHSDGAGIVDAVGDQVAAYKPGDRVWFHNAQWLTPTGAAADFVVLPETNLAVLDETLSFADGATFGVPALTAWRTIDLAGDLRGKTVLVTGGAGAVGNYAIQIAKAKGARVFATVSSDAKAAIATAAGADATIKYRQDDVPARIADLTDGKGVDHYVEVNFVRNVSDVADILAVDGSVVVYGSDTPEVTLPNVFALFGRRASLHFFIVYDLDETTLARGKADLAKLLKDEQVTPNVDQTFPFADIAKAHEAVEAGANGNVVLIHHEEN